VVSFKTCLLYPIKSAQDKQIEGNADSKVVWSWWEEIRVIDLN
jgi:hypothetical protein